jgi:Domain of unknown function (DUF4168)
MNRLASQTSRTWIVVAGLACGAGALDASAQVPEQPAAPPSVATPVPPETAPLQEEKLDQFAEAYIAIEEIERTANAELSQAKDDESTTQIKAEAEERIIDAVEGAGLRLDEFNQIAELAAVDKALRLKLADKVEKRRRI